jgi:hypothetical protein
VETTRWLPPEAISVLHASSYLPLLVGVAAPLVVLALVYATGRALENVRQHRGARRAARASTTSAKPVLGGLALSLFVASGVFFVVAAGLGLLVNQGGAQILPTSDPRPPVAPVGAGAPDRDREEASRAVKKKSPKTIRVSVLNGSDIQGLAATSSRRLRQKGFKVAAVDTAPEPREQSTVFFKVDMSRYARRVGRALGVSRRERLDRRVARLGENAGVVVVLGKDKASGRVQEGEEAVVLPTRSYVAP